VRIPAIKKGGDFITNSGAVIKNEDITVPGSDPLSYAYCSDTRYFPRLSSFIKNADLLYHEATFDRSLQELATVTGHSTTSDAARVAKEACVKALLIGHYSARYKDITPLVDEARELFPATFAAIDGSTYDVGTIFNQ
jgi:ribonuclease Z